MGHFKYLVIMKLHYFKTSFHDFKQDFAAFCKDDYFKWSFMQLLHNLVKKYYIRKFVKSGYFIFLTLCLITETRVMDLQICNYHYLGTSLFMYKRGEIWLSKQKKLEVLFILLQVPLEIVWTATVSWKADDTTCRIMVFFRCLPIVIQGGRRSKVWDHMCWTFPVSLRCFLVCDKAKLNIKFL